MVLLEKVRDRTSEMFVPGALVAGSLLWEFVLEKDRGVRDSRTSEVFVPWPLATSSLFWDILLGREVRDMTSGV